MCELLESGGRQQQLGSACRESRQTQDGTVLDAAILRSSAATKRGRAIRKSGWRKHLWLSTRHRENGWWVRCEASCTRPSRQALIN